MMAAESLVVGSTRKPMRWAEPAIVFSGWLIGTLLASLLLWIVIPMLVFGWKPMVVVSGSMSPLIRTGDVVMVDLAPEPPTAGSVVAFDSAAGVVIHRVLSVADDGTLTTRGDANARSDSSPVAPPDLIGVGRLLVPHLGLVRVIGWVWWGVVLTAAAVTTALWRSRPSLSAAVAAVLVGLISISAANAALASSTSNTGGSVTAVDIEPATGLVASCGAIGADTVEVDLSWTASTTAEVDGYRVQYDPGTGSAPVATVGSSETTFTHSIDVALLGVGNHTYAIEALANTWASEFSNSDTIEITEVLGVYVCTNL